VKPVGGPPLLSSLLNTQLPAPVLGSLRTAQLHMLKMIQCPNRAPCPISLLFQMVHFSISMALDWVSLYTTSATREVFDECFSSTGTAGYGNDTWAIGHSYADDPLLTPTIYDPSAAPGQRWLSSSNLSASTVPRLYHSSATLLPDGKFSTWCLLLASSLTWKHLL
jgi:hypothetical protein